jgi:hypothetical protein
MAAKDQEAKPASAEGQLIRELAELLNATGLSEIEIEKSGLKIRVAKELHVTGTMPMSYAAPVHARAERQNPSPLLPPIPPSTLAPSSRQWSARPTARRNQVRPCSARSARR